MDLSKTLGLIEDALREVPNLRKLRYSNAEYDLWCYKVVDILKAGFGSESDEYKRFAESVRPQKRTGTQWQLQEWYDRRLTKRAAALLSIVRKYELLGKEGSYPELGESQKSSATRAKKYKKGRFNNSGNSCGNLRSSVSFRLLRETNAWIHSLID